MTPIKSHEGFVQFADPTSPSGAEVSPQDFLKNCRSSALARFRQREPIPLGCRSIEYPVPALPNCDASTGMIVAHISPTLWRAWEATVGGSTTQRRSHIEEQIHLALADLAAQDMHGYLALTDAQRELFRPDLIQLVCESLDRTTFSHLGRQPDPHWEGTLVERVRPPYLVLAISIDLERVGRADVVRLKPSARRRPSTQAA